MKSTSEKIYYGYVYVGSKSMSQIRLYQHTEKTIRVQAYLESIGQYHVPVSIENITGKSEKAHLNNLKKLIKSCEKGSFLVMTSLYDISENEIDTATIYRNAWNSQVNLEFLDSPWLNIEFMKEAGVEKPEIACSIIGSMYYYDRHKSDVAEAVKEYSLKLRHMRQDHNKDKKLTTRKEVRLKPVIVARSKDFLGHESDVELLVAFNENDNLRVSRNTYYSYKRDISARARKISDLNKLYNQLLEEEEEYNKTRRKKKG